METLQDTLYSASVWAKEWQTLIAGLLVFFASLIFARAVLKAAGINATAARSGAEAKSLPDLRQATKPPSQPAGSTELISALEQLRSMVRSAMASLSQTNEKENGPAYFLCQRIAHLRLERFTLPPNATKAAHEMRASLSEQLESLRQCLAREASSNEISQVLVQLNASARNLANLLAAAPIKRHGSDSR